MDVITYALLKKEIAKIESLSPFTYKGSVANKAALPTNAKKGEVYTTLDDGAEYLYDGNQWVNLGADLSTIERQISEINDKLSALEPPEGYAYLLVRKGE